MTPKCKELADEASRAICDYLYEALLGDESRVNLYDNLCEARLSILRLRKLNPQGDVLASKYEAVLQNYLQYLQNYRNRQASTKRPDTKKKKVEVEGFDD